MESVEQVVGGGLMAEMKGPNADWCNRALEIKSWWLFFTFSKLSWWTCYLYLFFFFFGNLCRHTPFLLSKVPILQRLTFFSHLAQRMSFHRQWGCGEELLQQKIWKLVSINGKGKFSILKRNNNFNVHLGGGLSFICLAVRMQARNQVISEELNSPALLFSLAKLDVLCSVQDLFFSPPGKFCSFNTLPFYHRGFPLNWN